MFQTKQVLHNVAKDELVPPNNYDNLTVASPLPPHHISLLTFNIWFDIYYMEERCACIISIIQDLLPDFICLQEVTRFSYSQFSNSTFLRSTYTFCYDSAAQEELFLVPYGTCILVKKNSQHFKLLKFVMDTLPSRMDRCLHSAHVSLLNHCDDENNNKDELLLISTVHLESLNNAALRNRQLHVIHNQLLASFDNCVLCGDFNFDDTKNFNKNNENSGGDEVLENALLDTLFQDYGDVWIQVHGQEKGYTFDTVKNTNLSDFKFEQMRYDRVMVKKQQESGNNSSRILKPVSIKIIGNEPVNQGELKEVMPSDHFGLYCTFEICYNKK